MDIEAYAADPREAGKFKRTVEAVGVGPHARILEIGCGPGLAARSLALLGREYLGVDASPVAVELANERLDPIEGAMALIGRLPDGLPPGPFDVVVCSDVLYYLTPDELDRSIRAIMQRMDPCGVFVAVHHRHDIGLAMTGATVHQRLRAAMGLHLEVAMGDELIAVDRFRLDAWAAGTCTPSPPVGVMESERDASADGDHPGRLTRRWCQTPPVRSSARFAACR